MASDHIADRLIGFDGITHIAMQKLSQPYKILHIKRLIKAKGYFFGFQCRLGNPWPLQHFQRTSCKTHNGIINNGNSDQNRNCNQDPFDNVFTHGCFPPFLLVR